MLYKAPLWRMSLFRRIAISVRSPIMLYKNTPLRPSQLNGNIYACLDGYDANARQHAETQDIHAHVHEYSAITLKNSIETDKSVQVHVRWSMYGDQNPFITGTWHVSAVLESLQSGNIQRITLTPETTIALTPRHGPVDYETWVKIPANTVTLDEDEHGKSYKRRLLVVTITYNAPSIPTIPPNSGVAALALHSHFILVTPLVYRDPTGCPDPITDCITGSELQFYIIT